MKSRLFLAVTFLLVGILLSGCSRRSVVLDAIEANDTTTLRRLLKEDAYSANKLDENYYYRNTYNALQYACFVNRPDSVLALLQHGVDPNRLSADGQHAPLLIAVGQKNVEIVRILLAHGANPDLQNSRGATALHIAAETAESEPVIRVLLAGSARPRILSHRHQDSPIAYAVMFKQRDNLILLLRLCSVDKEVLDKACNCAAMRNYLDGVRILLDAGADANYVLEVSGNTALHYAVDNGNTEMEKLLLSKGARTDIRNADGLTPYEQNPSALRPAVTPGK